MSVQLILYPQSYEGVYNAFSGSPYEAIVNGISFTNLDNTQTYTTTSATPFVDTLTNEPPSIINTWYRFRKNLSGTSAFPTVSLANLVLESGNLNITGVYQQLTNLTIGQPYVVTINISTPQAGGSVVVAAYDGITLQSTTSFGANLTQITKTFLAVASEMNLMISYSHPAALNLEISSISALPIGSTTADPILSDGQVILDLYEDEDLPLTLSVDNFKNVAEKVQSYSKAFNLPATKRNNKIFNQIFEITRSDDGAIFSPYKKSECVLKQDGFILFKGYLRLLDVTDKDGEISYNVNLYSEVIALADYLKELSFRDLDFTELTHDYNLTNIQATWSATGVSYTNPNTSGFRTSSSVKYPFVDWNHQFILGASGNPVLPNLESAFRPFINIKYIIERIFENTPFTFTSNFFDTTDFEKLYMDFNWGSADTPSLTSITTFLGKWAQASGQTNFPSVYAGTTFTNLELYFAPWFPTPNPPNYDESTNIITATTDGEQYDISGYYNIENDSAIVQFVDCQWLYNNIPIAATQLEIQPFNMATFNFAFNQVLFTGDTLQAQFKRSDPLSAATVRQLQGGQNVTSQVTFNVNILAITSSSLLQTLRGDLGQWEFLKGLITMFNLVTIPDENNPNNIKFEPYVDVFINNPDSIQLNWTDKIDVSEMKLEPLTDLNRRTIFKFVEDEDDFAFMNYKHQVGGHLYGSKKFNATDEFNILDGLDEVIAEPFAATVIKPLMDNFPEFITPALYSMGEDGVSEGFENSPRIMYDNGSKTLSSTTYSIPAQNGVVADALVSQFLQFSHLSAIPTITTVPPAITDTRDFHFGECQLLTGDVPTVNNLFNLYWLPYYNELYNPNTRTMTIKVNLNPSDINLFKFNDTIFIKNRIFRCNRIDYKPNDLATVEFILIP
jgi:hypothetical protein